jgi:hypothetical protein
MMVVRWLLLLLLGHLGQDYSLSSSPNTQLGLGGVQHKGNVRPSIGQCALSNDVSNITVCPHLTQPLHCSLNHILSRPI